MKTIIKEWQKLVTHKVAIIDDDIHSEMYQTLQDSVTVDDITEGFDFYIALSDDGTYLELIDIQDDDGSFNLGKTYNEALYELNRFTEYFNCEGDWVSDFTYYMKEKEVE